MQSRCFVDTAGDWWKWGLPVQRKSLPDYPGLKRFLEASWHCSLDQTLEPCGRYPVLADEERSAKVVQLFSSAVPGLKITADRAQLLRRAIGKSYPELLAAATGQPLELADALIFPKTQQEVEQVLRIASAHRVLVLPFGGGTNVVGALKVSRPGPRIILDLCEMNRLVALDAEHLTASFQAGISGPALEKILNEEGCTLGHFPQSFEYSTLGGWIATHSAGQESSTYGRIDDGVLSLKVILPAGPLVTGRYEADAEGIALRDLFLGSEGMLGVVTEATLRIHPLPATRKWVCLLFPEFRQGVAALKELTQQGVVPAVVRYSDEQETGLLSLMSTPPSSFISRIKSKWTAAWLRRKGLHRPCLMMLRIDGPEPLAKTKSRMAVQLLKKRGGFPVGERPGRKWEATRFQLPYLQDDLIERGILVDTVETVLPWNRICDTRQALQAQLKASKAFHEGRGILLAHVSHVYSSSACIYFTLIAAQVWSDPFAQWRTLKALALDTVLKEGGAVSHHHSIGTDLKPWYLQRTDPLTRKILKSIKRAVDPHAILNPGKSFDE